ncbi:hypothetical protein V6N13_045512 [Hibiscus sabdariffa]
MSTTPQIVNDPETKDEQLASAQTASILALMDWHYHPQAPNTGDKPYVLRRIYSNSTTTKESACAERIDAFMIQKKCSEIFTTLLLIPNYFFPANGRWKFKWVWEIGVGTMKIRLRLPLF